MSIAASPASAGGGGGSSAWTTALIMSLIAAVTAVATAIGMFDDGSHGTWTEGCWRQHVNSSGSYDSVTYCLHDSYQPTGAVRSPTVSQASRCTLTNPTPGAGWYWLQRTGTNQYRCTLVSTFQAGDTLVPWLKYETTDAIGDTIPVGFP